MELTKFYLPGSSGSLTMDNEESDISSEDRDSPREDKIKTDPDWSLALWVQTQGKFIMSMCLNAFDLTLTLRMTQLYPDCCQIII